MKFDIEQVEANTMRGLKDFQLATVSRITELFESNKQQRVLVADEVGLGKTLIARGVIVETARIRKQEGDDLFKVAYICSNQSIAAQNISKLKISEAISIEDDISDTRLSMQHLKIAEQENNPLIKEGYVQLIPLTPGTSFQMTNGQGLGKERALIFAVLKRFEDLKDCIEGIEAELKRNNSAWISDVNRFDIRIEKVNNSSDNSYVSKIVNKIKEYDENLGDKSIIKDIKLAVKGEIQWNKAKITSRLRTMFAFISASMLEPDLVIMDEFQQFKTLLNADENSDTGILVKNFLTSQNSTRVLLLSATPYKLYSTLDEIAESNVDEHYKEFIDLTNFLFDGSETDFTTIWRNYSVLLKEASKNNITELRIVKNDAENALFNGVCRTERISVMDSNDYTSSDEAKAVDVGRDDILSYMKLQTLLSKFKDIYEQGIEIGTNKKTINVISRGFRLPVDYVKSCPYLLSFMRNYEVNRSIKSFLSKYPENISKIAGDYFWIDYDKVVNYESIPSQNARLNKLKEIAFSNNAEMLLWMPPSKPYYDLQGVYKNTDNFSKILVFSAWEMVPRMIGALLSYDFETKTLGRLYDIKDMKGKENARYNAKYRYPSGRLDFVYNEKSDSAIGKNLSTIRNSLSLMSLIYPSAYLANIYNPIEFVNKLCLEEIKNTIAAKIDKDIAILEKNYSDQDSDDIRIDKRWYYLMPMLMDGKDFALDWINENRDSEKTGWTKNFDRLEEYLTGNLVLGKKPKDLTEVLVNQAIGSFAVCAYRLFRKCFDNDNLKEVQNKATYLAKNIVEYLNTTESTAVIELVNSVSQDIEQDSEELNASHWKRVLKYSVDGCFQAMLDEYYHIASENYSFLPTEEKFDKTFKYITKAIDGIRSVPYSVYTGYEKTDKGITEKSINIRANFAMGFIQGDGEKAASSKDNLKNAFNSPFRPFVLATTSIGQEGLDFHNYCRKIVHWNLPHNPTDLEQREGRINRFKCLAIRQNVALKYGNIEFENDIWQEMFEAAKQERKENNSELIPFWCFGKNQVVKIERIVPMYPISKDENSYDRLIKILSLYRLTLGQANQEMILENICKEGFDKDDVKELFISLCPYEKVADGNNTLDMLKKAAQRPVVTTAKVKTFTSINVREEIVKIMQEHAEKGNIIITDNYSRIRYNFTTPTMDEVLPPLNENLGAWGTRCIYHYWVYYDQNQERIYGVFELGGRNLDEQRHEMQQKLIKYLRPIKFGKPFTYNRIFKTKWYTITRKEKNENEIRYIVDSIIEDLLLKEKETLKYIKLS